LGGRALFHRRNPIAPGVTHGGSITTTRSDRTASGPIIARRDGKSDIVLKRIVADKLVASYHGNAINFFACCARRCLRQQRSRFRHDEIVRGT
jgi:hypothetical protein